MIFQTALKGVFGNFGEEMYKDSRTLVRDAGKERKYKS